MKYQLTKIGPRSFGLSSGDDPTKNRVSTTFKSAQSAINFARHRDIKNEVFIAGTEVNVTDAIAKSMDIVKVKDEIRHSFPDVKSYKFKKDRTTVVLGDGRVGVSIRHEGDKNDEMEGFLHAFKNARTKRLTSKNVNILMKDMLNRTSIGGLMKSLLG